MFVLSDASVVISESSVNGMEVDEKPPALEKMVSIASQEEIWPVMATELDHKGYTPLLWACKVYRDYKPVNNFMLVKDLMSVFIPLSLHLKKVTEITLWTPTLHISVVAEGQVIPGGSKAV